MPLKLPLRVDQVGDLTDWESSPYPPTGFLAFADHELGNGDTFGLYWPIGREGQEPIVVETLHDEQALAPAYSSLATFLDLTGDLDEYPPRPTLEDDPASPLALLVASRAASAAGDVENAIETATAAASRLPEYAGAHIALWALHLRSGNVVDACRSAVRGVRSSPSFRDGMDAGKVWRWLARQADAPEDLRDDPIWVARAALEAPPSGGMKANSVYAVLTDAVASYQARGAIVEALTLFQAYAEYMFRETTAFQERHGFSLETYRQRRLALEALLPTGLRQRNF